MNTSSAACPLDQISIITLKRCPYLFTYLLEIIRIAWESKQSPAADWKRAITILIHKKGPNDDSQKFRPTTLKCVFLKVYIIIITIIFHLIKVGVSIAYKKIKANFDDNNSSIDVWATKVLQKKHVT